MLDKLFVFDIETIPDTEAVYNLLGIESDDINFLRNELEKYHIEVSGGNPFPRQMFHKPISVSVLIADIEKYNSIEYYKISKIGTFSSLRNTEKEIVEKFFDYLSKHLPRIVDYNGRTFDLPVMKYRAMKYCVSAPKLFKAGDKWNNYQQKYSSDWHCDLLDVLSDFGSSCRSKMNEVCSILGIPGKIGTDGSQVVEMFDNGKLEEIDNYCETDVINTYLVYLHYQLLTGSINNEGFIKMNKDLIQYLTNENKEHFNEFLEEWKKVDNKNIF